VLKLLTFQPKLIVLSLEAGSDMVFFIYGVEVFSSRSFHSKLSTSFLRNNKHHKTKGKKSAFTFHLIENISHDNFNLKVESVKSFSFEEYGKTFAFASNLFDFSPN
jgi:hypothetical protein